MCGSVKDQFNNTVNGFAMCGHDGKQYDDVTIGSTKVGKIQSIAFYSTLDMAFVNMADYPNSGYVRTRKIGTSNDTINAYGNVGNRGSYYTLFGNKSKVLTGTVDEPSFTFQMDGIWFSDFIRMKLPVQRGDSGGPLVTINGTSATKKSNRFL